MLAIPSDGNLIGNPLLPEIAVAGHLQERGPKTWRLSVYVGRDSRTGKKRYAQRTVKGTKREAERALARLVTEVDEGRHAASAAGTFGNLLDRWLETKAQSVERVDDLQLPVGDREVHPSRARRRSAGHPQGVRHRFLLCAPRGPARRARQEAFAEDHPHLPWSDPPGP